MMSESTIYKHSRELMLRILNDMHNIRMELFHLFQNNKFEEQISLFYNHDMITYKRDSVIKRLGELNIEAKNANSGLFSDLMSFNIATQKAFENYTHTQSILNEYHNSHILREEAKSSLHKKYLMHLNLNKESKCYFTDIELLAFENKW